jgi:hypothetical protein
MANKKNDDKDFDLLQALEDCPKPDWYKIAFVKVMDTSKIKSQTDLNRLMKKFGEMK